MGQLLCRSERAQQNRKRREPSPDAADPVIEAVAVVEIASPKRARTDYEINLRDWKRSLATQDVIAAIDLSNRTNQNNHSLYHIQVLQAIAEVLGMARDFPDLNARHQHMDRPVFMEILRVMERSTPLAFLGRQSTPGDFRMSLVPVLNKVLGLLIDRVRERPDTIDWTQTDRHGNTLLHASVCLMNTDNPRHAELVELIMINMEGHMDAQNREGHTAMIHHVYAGSRKWKRLVLSKLIEHKANPSIKDPFGRTVLHWLVLKTDYESLVWMMSRELCGIDWMDPGERIKETFVELARKIYNEDPNPHSHANDPMWPDTIRIAKVCEQWDNRCKLWLRKCMNEHEEFTSDTANIVIEYLDGSGKPWNWREIEAAMDAEIEELAGGPPVMPA